MYSVKIRDHIMIAHSLHHEGFGVASHLHGATYIIDVTFSSSELNDMNVVIDIGGAAHILKRIVSALNFKNLDDLEEMKGKITTTEFLAHFIHQKVSLDPSLKFKGDLKVDLGESHIAWASYAAHIDTL